MKKYIVFLLCLMMILPLVSCELNEDQDTLSQNENTDSDSIEKDNTNNTSTQIPEAEKAMQMYEAAINDEICVIDEHLGKIKLKACRFPSDNLRLDECEILSKAILDMDEDGINEYVIQSETKDHIVLHYYDGKIYSYGFESKSLYRLNTDGTFYWYDIEGFSTEQTIITGLNRITFHGTSVVIEEIYEVTNVFEGEYYTKFYFDGRQVTRGEYLDYYNSNNKTWVQFSPLDISCKYPISSDKACEIASKYWGFESGMDEGAAGTYIIHLIVISEKPNSDTLSYRISWQAESYSHIYDGWECFPPKEVVTYEELLVDAITGECRAYIESDQDGKG